MDFQVQFELDQDKEDVGQLTVRTREVESGSTASWTFSKRIQMAEASQSEVVSEIKKSFSDWVDRRKKEHVFEELLRSELAAERDRKIPPLGAELEIEEK